MKPHVVAIIPAAGRSRRMGRPKQLLPVHGEGMLSAVASTVAASSVDGVLVVTHSLIARQLQIDWGRIRLTLNDDPSSEMIDSIRIGMDAWERRAPTDGYMIVPGDLPGLSAADVDRCLEAFRGDPGTIVIATYGGRRGHPMIFPAALSAAVRGAVCDNGLRALAGVYPDLVRLTACPSAAVTRDIDTPEDYEAFGRDPGPQ